MATSDNHDAMPSSASAIACAVHHRLGHIQTPPLSDRVEDPAASCPPNTESTTLTDIHDASFLLCSATSFSDGDGTDVTNCDIPTFSMTQLKAGFVWLFRLVVALVVQVAVIASDVVSLKDRITAVEDTQVPASVHGQETVVLARQVIELRERVTSQEDRIACLERSQRLETESYEKKIKELATAVDEIKSDDKRVCHDTFENLCQSFKSLQLSMECQAARITAVKADTARKIVVLQSELAGIRTELAQVKMVTVSADIESAYQAAKEARKARILASVTQRMEDGELAREIDELCPVPPVARSSARVGMPAASTSSGGLPITLPSYNIPEETRVKNLKITKKPLTTVRTNVGRPGAVKIPAKSIIPLIPLSTIPMERTIPMKGSGKENRPRDSSTTTLQHTQKFQPGAGRTPDVSDKPPTASQKKARYSAGSPEISARPTRQPCRAMLLTSRKPQLPSLAKHAVVINGSLFREVKVGNRPPGGPAARTRPPKTIKSAAIVKLRSPLRSPTPTLVEKGLPVGLPVSSSLAALDAALQARELDGENLLAPMPVLDGDDLSFSPIQTIPTSMVEMESVVVLPASSSLAALDAALPAKELDGEDLLAPMPTLDCDSLGFSPIRVVPTSMKPRRKRNDKYESKDILPKQRNMLDAKPTRSPLKSMWMACGNRVTGPASSLPSAEGGGDIMLLPKPDDYSMERPSRHKGIYVSPMKSVKPSQRL